MENSKKGSAVLVTFIGIVVLVAAGGYYFVSQKDRPIIVEETSQWKTYTNTKYGYKISFPDSFSDYGIVVGQGKGVPAVKTNGTGTQDGVVLSKNNLAVFDPEIYKESIVIERENGEFFIKDAKSVDDFWSRIKKTDNDGNIVNKYTESKIIDGIKFIIYEQKNLNIWEPQALFYYNNNFFSVSGSGINRELFDQMLSTFKFQW